MRLSSFIIEHRESILQEWEEFARSIELPPSTMDVEALRDHASLMLDTIVRDLETPQSSLEQLDKSKGQGLRGSGKTQAESHAESRFESGYSIDQLVSEFRALRASVLKLWAKKSSSALATAPEDTTRFNEAIDQALAESVARYSHISTSLLQQSETRYRTLLDSMDEGYCVIEMIFDADNRPADYRFLEVNPAFEKHAGLRNARGKRIRELAPDFESHWFETFGRVAATGEAIRFVNEAKELNGRWFDVCAFRFGDIGSHKVAILFNDISDRKASEDALKASESRSRSILESITDGFYFLDRDWRYSYINAAGERILGRLPGDLIGKSLWDEFPGTVGSEFERVYRRVIATQVGESFTAYYPNFDRWYELTANPASEGLTVYFRDVTDRRKVEEERQYFAALVDASSDFIGVAGLDQRGIYLNRAGEVLIGLSPGKVNSISVLDCFPESERQRVIGLIADSEGRDHVVEDTFFQHLQTGELIPVSWSFLKLRDADGNISGYATVTRDLTESNNAENLLRASEERRQLALDAAELGTWHIEPATDAIQIDARFRAIFGMTEESEDYVELLALIHPDDLSAVQEAVAAATRAENPVPYAIEYRVVHPDGSLRWVMAKGRPSYEGIEAARRVTSFDGTVADVTERKQGEEEREQLVARLQDQDQRKDEFLAMLAHELRNPLAPISAAADLLRLAGADAARVKQTSEIISRQVNHMTALVDDLLDVSRVTRGLIKLEKTNLDVKSIVSGAVEQVRPLIEARRHHLSVHMPPQTALVNGDVKRLIQVVVNLLNNASKFTPEGGNISITFETDEKQVALKVADNGIGMAPDVLSRVFELFAQAERASDRSQGGLGIGLAVVDGLVKLHGGKIRAHSAGLGLGSEFTLRLPRLEHQATNREESPPEELTLMAAAKPLKIMVVDDNIDAAQMLGMLLEALGHQVNIEHSSKRALERIMLEAPDVCLLDIGLPDIDGNELARRLRSQSENAQSVLIAVTGYGQEEDRKNTLAAGFDHHLVKPVNSKKLASILAQIKSD